MRQASVAGVSDLRSGGIHQVSDLIDAASNSAHTAVMTVRVLGALDTGAASLQPRERSIFSALVLRLGQPLSVDELAVAYWGDAARPTTWPAQVKVSVGRIRARVGKD